MYRIMVENGWRHRFMRILYISVVVALTIIFNEPIAILYANLASKTTVSVKYLLHVLYQYQDDISRFMFRCILPSSYYSEADYPKHVSSARRFLMRILIHLQVTKCLKVALGFARRFWSSPRGPSPGVERQKAQNKALSPPLLPLIQVHATPRCKCRLFPREFHWLLHDGKEASLRLTREPNDLHNSIVKLFDLPNQQICFDSREDFMIFSEPQASLREETLANDEYTGWSEKMLKSQDSKTRYENDDKENWSLANPSSALDENEKIESPAITDGQSLEANDENFHPFFILLENTTAENPVDVNLVATSPEEIQVELDVLEPEQAPKEASEGGGCPNRRRILIRVGTMSRRSSVPIICMICSQGDQGPAINGFSDIKSVGGKMQVPVERSPRSTYTIVNSMR